MTADSRYAEVAAALGGRPVLEFWSFEADFSLARQREIDSIPIDPDQVFVIPAPFSLVAAVTTEVEGQLRTSLAYVFESPDRAAEMVEPLEVIWSRSADSLLWPPIEQIGRVEDVRSEGSVAVVTLALGDDVASSSIFDWLVTREYLFVHE